MNATAIPRAAAGRRARPLRIAAGVLLLLLLAALGWFLWNLDFYRGQARVGTAYAARMACACRHIQNRPLAQCSADFEPGMEPISLSEDAAAATVTATFPLLGQATVAFTRAEGCQFVRP
jgi:hypothetical protein